MTSVSNFLLSFVFVSVYFFLFVFFLFLSLWFLYTYDFSKLYLLSRGWQCTRCPQPLALTRFPPREVLWFWLVLLVCPACPTLAAAIVWVVLCPFGRATFIGWCPLEPPRCSLGGVRWRGGALLVLLFLLFDLLNDLPDPPLCSLGQGRRNGAREEVNEAQ